MKAMVFAAGLGTRLRPLTDHTPKALVRVGGKTMLEYAIYRLIDFGVSEMIINVHHFADQVVRFIQEHDSFGITIAVSDESGQLLDTGGGLKKAAWFFDDGNPFILHNVDVMSKVDFGQMLQDHKSASSLVTLAVSQRSSSRYLLMDHEMNLCGWESPGTDEKKMARSDAGDLKRYAFSGIHIIEPEVLKFMTEEGKFSLVDAYLRLAGQHRIRGFEHAATDWIDMGKPADLQRALELIQQGIL